MVRVNIQSFYVERRAGVVRFYTSSCACTGATKNAETHHPNPADQKDIPAIVPSWKVDVAANVSRSPRRMGLPRPAPRMASGYSILRHADVPPKPPIGIGQVNVKEIKMERELSRLQQEGAHEADLAAS